MILKKVRTAHYSQRTYVELEFENPAEAGKFLQAFAVWLVKE